MTPAGASLPSGARTAGPFAEFAREQIEQSLSSRFEEQAARHPKRLAVRAGRSELTYAELDGAANAVAVAVLERLGEGSEPVALLYQQGAPLVAAILGILKAGKAYVPLDPSYPETPLARLLEDVGARLVVTDAPNLALAERLGARALLADGLGRVGKRPLVAVAPDDHAYVFYTSGSTGRPKGVVDCHRNVLHNIMRYTNGLAISSHDRLTLLQSASFSGAVSSLFGALLNGAAVLPFDLRAEGPGSVAAWLAENELTIYHSVPAIFRRVAAAPLACPSLRLIRLEGDQASRRDLELFTTNAPEGCILVNGLGATECGIVRRLFVERGTEIARGVVPIGYPVEDMDVHVLDGEGSEVADGEVGEIAVRSRFLAVGYWQRADLTEAAFRPDPDGGDARVYRTGDLGRMQPDGCLEYLGRKDFEAKVRGHRVEIETIEAALGDVAGVQEAAVTTRPGPDGDPRIVAYVVADAVPPPTAGGLRRSLSARLPVHSMPARFVLLDALPLTENGKVDRGALPGLTAARPALGTQPLRPRTTLERKLAELWEELLGVGPVGIRDDFQELGGDSLLAAALLVRIEETFGESPPFSLLATNGTIEELATALLDDAYAAPEPPIVSIQQGGLLAPLFYVHGDFLGGALVSSRLARELGPDRPVFAIRPHGLRGEAVPPTIETMASDRLEALRSLHPAGTCVLVGHCQPGGLVAFEMARRLEAEDRPVDLLALVETVPPNTRYRLLHAARGARFLAEILGRGRRLDATGRAELFLSLRASALRLAGLSRHARDNPALPQKEIAYARAVRGYVPGAYRGRVLVLWPEEQRGYVPRDVLADWRRVAKRAELEIVPGNHETTLTRHLGTLAERLRGALQEGEAGLAPNRTT